MLKRTLGALLTVVLLTAAFPAFASPAMDRTEPALSWVERVWEEVRELFVLDAAPDRPSRVGSSDEPRRMSAADEGSQGHDPDG